MNTRRDITLLLVLALIPILSSAQIYEGTWSGSITQYGRSDKFLYHLDLRKKGTLLLGRAMSEMQDGRTAEFEIEGNIQGDVIFLEETAQVSPVDEKWCLKKFRFEYRKGETGLHGVWTAQDCQPGTAVLYPDSLAISNLLKIGERDLTGTWNGHLSQSDRLYGFFYAINFVEDPADLDYSYIISEGEGGEARHRFEWEFDSLSQMFTLTEYKVFDQTQPEWLWCYKKAKLTVKTDGYRIWMEGDWWGELIDDRVCAPGKIYLEREPEVTKLPDRPQYEINFDRTMNVLRTLKTDKDQIDLYIWDNNVLDGDIITMYWNDKEVLSRHRLSRSERHVRLELKQRDNYLVLHAENTGDISPNTAAIRVDYGDREEVLVLSSNFTKSGAIFIHKVSRD